LGLNGEADYWIAKCLLELNRTDDALELLANAFASKRLPKDYCGCYLKLLLLKGDTGTIEELIGKQAQRFSADQKHWAHGAIALQSGQTETALSHFQKVKGKVTPDDVPEAWIAYTQQARSNWDGAAIALEGRRSHQTATHPALERLIDYQQAKTGQGTPHLGDRRSKSQIYQEAIRVSETLQLIEQGNLHDAGHAFLKLDRRSTHFPELATLYRPLLTLAGQQALEDEQPECAEAFWKPLVAEQSFDPQLAVLLLQVLEINSSDRERQRLLTRLLKWVEVEAKQNPQNWPDSRLKPTLAKLHCQQADSWMALNQYRTALGSVRQAERIYPESEEVLGRRGLIAAYEDNYEEATELLTQALEKGCRFQEVYAGLLRSWRELGDQRSLNEARRRFGKHFGDVSVGFEVETPLWIEALSSQSYPLFSRLIEDEEGDDPAVRACQTFLSAAGSNLTPSGRVRLYQELAESQWDALLAQLSPQEKIPALQAIVLSLQLFAKREKGLSALTNQYTDQLLTLGEREPDAIAAYLVMLAVKGSKPKQIQSPLRRYLDASTQPGAALAKIQLMARRFTQTDALASFIDEALQREPQNPQLLLAKATTHPADSQAYQDLQQQGFDLARRLQDAAALQAFREEQAFLNTLETQQLLPDLDRLDSLDLEDVDDFLENLIRKVVGKNMPPDELKRMMPELKKKMLEGMPGFDDFDSEPIGFSFPHGEPTAKAKKSKRRRR
jgi:tetratricopeptide (TPR) repeat protein